MRVTIYVQPDTDVTDTATIEELMIARNQLEVINAGYGQLTIAPPEWIIDQLDAVNKEIVARVQGDLSRMLKAAKARRSALRTVDEKRQELDAEIQNLESQLNK